MNGAIKVSRAEPQKEPPTLQSLFAGVKLVHGNRPFSEPGFFAVLLGGATALLFIYACNILHPSLRDVERLE